MTGAWWWVAALVVGCCGGFLGGLLGVGGGIIMVPLLVSWLGKGAHDAKAISLAIICIVGVSGTIEHQRQGRLEWPLILVAGVTAAIMSPLGARLSEKISREQLLQLFAILLIVTGVRYLVAPLLDRRKPAEQPVVTEPAERK